MINNTVKQSNETKPKILSITSKISDEPGSVSSENIENNAITENKIANGAVTENKIANGAVTLNKLENFTNGSKLLMWWETTVAALKKIEEWKITVDIANNTVDFGSLKLKSTGTVWNNNDLSTKLYTNVAVSDKFSVKYITGNSVMSLVGAVGAVFTVVLYPDFEFTLSVGDWIVEYNIRLEFWAVAANQSGNYDLAFFDTTNGSANDTNIIMNTFSRKSLTTNNLSLDYNYFGRIIVVGQPKKVSMGIISRATSNITST